MVTDPKIPMKASAVAVSVTPSRVTRASAVTRSTPTTFPAWMVSGVASPVAVEVTVVAAGPSGRPKAATTSVPSAASSPSPSTSSSVWSTAAIVNVTPASATGPPASHTFASTAGEVNSPPDVVM
ncbi:hypothetical protein [Leifsonia sp. EB41]|uniref:hypothetical protein n=1 Tax=Leifsonia sp. EB41 TaxID=3156260 RepID=UPI0035184932